jgi:hypothetical protein
MARHSVSPDWIAALVLIFLAIWLFRGHFIGDSLWIGNPDRLNGDLKILKHYMSGETGGQIAAWNEHEMMGYDSFVLPYTFPNPLAYFIGLFGERHLYVAMGYAAIVMLAATGIAAYCFIRSAIPAGLPALAGAICYEFSTLTLLKVSQNSMSIAIFIVIPLAALAVRHIRRETAAICFLCLAVLLGCMLNYMFLQKAAYALMLVGAYALWRSVTGRSWYPVLVFGVAFAIAIAFAAPRIAGVAMAIQEYARTEEGVDLKNFDALYRYQFILPSEILRWFDYAIWGRSPSDVQVLRNRNNLTEGFLLSTAAIAPFVLLTGLMRDPRGWLDIRRPSGNEAAFFFWALVACVSVIVVKPVAHAIFLLFLRIDFTHARILISALLPQSMLLALALTALTPRSARPTSMRTLLAGLAVGLLAALAIEAISGLLSDAPALAIYTLNNMRSESLLRIALSMAVYAAFLGILLLSSTGPQLRRATHAAICSLLAGQCLLAANQQINGPQTFDFVHPFLRGDFYYARRAEFAPPTEDQLRALHQRIEPMKYRVALVCDQNIAGGFCAGHVPEFWQLRAIDGYYGLGVPRRLRALPWPTGLGLRTISFLTIDQVPWDLLGLLNVRSVLVSSDGVYRNIVRDGNTIVGRPDPSAFELVASPARVTPRAFFASSVEPVASPDQAVERLFRPEGIVDPLAQSFVEGLPNAQQFDASGAITLKGSGDLMELEFDPVPTERFLVLNDLYFPGWHAEIGGSEVAIFPTNAVMRGVLVPPGAKSLRFRYVTPSRAPGAWVFQASAVLLMLGVFFALRRLASGAY